MYLTLEELQNKARKKDDMTNEALEHEVDLATTALTQAITALEVAATDARDAKAALDNAEAEAWMNDLVIGSNDTKRKLWLRDNFAPQYKAMDDAERAKAVAQYHYDIAKAEMDRVKLIVALRTA